MSAIITLLVDFPNYSARKVRRLAKQIAILGQATNTVDEPSVLRGIEADLLEYNLQCAKTEAQANDDIGTPKLAIQVKAADQVKRNWWGADMALPDTLEEAHDWINDMLDQWKELAENMGFETFQDPEVIIERAKDAAPKNPEEITERICVTPVAAARRALDHVINMVHGLDYDSACILSANGMINGQSFYTDKRIIQARLSPQEDLPLNSAD